MPHGWGVAAHRGAGTGSTVRGFGISSCVLGNQDPTATHCRNLLRQVQLVRALNPDWRPIQLFAEEGDQQVRGQLMPERTYSTFESAKEHISEMNSQKLLTWMVSSWPPALRPLREPRPNLLVRGVQAPLVVDDRTVAGKTNFRKVQNQIQKGRRTRSPASRSTAPSSQFPAHRSTIRTAGSTC